MNLQPDTPPRHAMLLAKFAAPLSLLVLALTTSGCAGLIMSVDDVGGSNTTVSLAAGDSVAVAMPSIAGDQTERINKAKLTPTDLAQRLQIAMVGELSARGILATAGTGASTLQIHISVFSDGSGAARAFLGGGYGESKLNGTATLSTPAGRRELEIEKTGSKGGVANSGSQASENIGYFASALASKLVP